MDRSDSPCIHCTACSGRKPLATGRHSLTRLMYRLLNCQQNTRFLYIMSNAINNLSARLASLCSLTVPCARALYERILKKHQKCNCASFTRYDLYPNESLKRHTFHQEGSSSGPDYVEAQSNLGVSLRKAHRFEEAFICYRKALALTRMMLEHITSWHVLQDMKRSEEALVCYRKALAINPRYAERIIILARLSGSEACRGSAACYQQLINQPTLCRCTQ